MSGWDDQGSLGETGAMKAALPRVEAQAPARAADGPKTDWVEKTAYNYEEDDTNREWEVNATVYEWDGEEGDLGPEHPELEVVLFGKPEERSGHGIDFSKINQINVTQEGMKRIDPISSFKNAGLHPAMLKNIEMCGYTTPTPIQRYCIPAIKLGYDLIAVAQTGSGKTCAYLVPILNHLMGKAKKLAAPRRPAHEYDSGAIPLTRAEPLVVVVCPARELAIQIFNEARKLCYRSMLRPAVVYGGAPMRDQIGQLGKGCDILVATPGRLIDMMERPHVLSLRRVRYMVIDEADEMLHSDWEEEFTKILTGGEQEEGNVKYMLFSATFPTPVRQLAKTHLAPSHVRIRVGRVGSTTDNIKQDIVFVDYQLKRQALHDLLYSVEPGRIIVFVNSKRTADELDDFLFNKGLPVTSMHSDRTQREREDSMRAFRSGQTPILVTTGVTARGIDVRNVKHVINFDLPSNEHGGIDEYIHRIGRTGRIGHHGTATSFYNERDEDLAPMLTLTLLENKQEIPDFLQQYVPEDVDNLKFEDDTDDEKEAEEAAGAGGDDAWGGGGSGGGGSGGGDDGAGAWGASGAPSAPAAADTPAAAPVNGGADAWGGNSGGSGGGAW